MGNYFFSLSTILRKQSRFKNQAELKEKVHKGKTEDCSFHGQHSHSSRSQKNLKRTAALKQQLLTIGPVRLLLVHLPAPTGSEKVFPSSLSKEHNWSMLWQEMKKICIQQSSKIAARSEPIRMLPAPATLKSIPISCMTRKVLHCSLYYTLGSQVQIVQSEESLLGHKMSPSSTDPGWCLTR